MNQKHLNIVTNEFSTQVAQLWSGAVPAHLRGMVAQLNLAPNEAVIDVAAGSCRVSRAIASLVKSVVAVEVTAAMLNQGKAMARAEGLTNIDFQLGYAEQLAFADETFDVAITRYAFHHFVDMPRVLTEMTRVVRPGGRVVIIDILSPEEDEAAKAYNYYQTLRDPSHVDAPSLSGLKEWYNSCQLDIVSCQIEETTPTLEGWLNLPSMTDSTSAQSRDAVRSDIAGEGMTGLRPFMETGEMKFREQVATMVGQK